MAPQSQFPYVVSYDPGSGKFVLNSNWSPAYSGQRRVNRVNLNKALYQQRKQFQLERNIKDMAKGKLPGYTEVEGEYMIPATGDKEKDLKRIEADYLNMQILGKAKAIEKMEDDMKPGGWRGVLADAIDTPVGGVVMRGLDILSRPGYAVAEATDSVLKSSRGESPNHPGWYSVSAGSAPDAGGGEGFWENRETGKVEFHPDWESVDDGPTPAGALKGAWRGLSGKDKTSFADVLRDNDILEGKPAAVVGFGLDVVADPLNAVSFGTSGTLRSVAKEGAEEAAQISAREMVQAGLVKGPLAERRAYGRALKEELEKVGLSRRNVDTVVDDINSSYGSQSIERAFKDRVEGALKDPFWNKSTQRSIASQARKIYNAERTVLGEPIDAAVRKQVGLDALKQARDDFTSKVGADVMDEIATRKALRENLKLDIKVAGHTVASSKSAGKLIQKTSAAARATRPGQILARTFRTDAEIGDALHRIQRQFSNVSAAQFEEEAKSVKKIFIELGLSKGQRQKISKALETGDTKGFTTEMVDGFSKAREFFRSAFDREASAGALSATDFKDNYVYHVYREPNFRRGIGSWVKPTGRGATKFRTLDEAAAAGARPLTDVADILVYRLAKSHRVASSHLMMRAIAARFGVGISGKTVAGKALKGLEGKGLMIEGKKIAGAGRFFDKGVYFDQDVAASLSKMNQMFSNDELITRFGRLFDQVQARMKFLQTAPNPGFHIRNTMSDMFVNFLDGVTTLKPYNWSAKLLSGRGDNLVLTLKNGEELTGAEILELYDGMGLRAGFFHAEAGIVPGMQRKIFSGSSNVIRRASEIREDAMRMAHFVDALDKVPGRVGRAEEVAEIAAKRVRKYNFDYQDLTNIEKRIFRRAVPFYCVPEDHEILTKQGWKRHGDLTVGEDVLVLDPQTHENRWEPVQDIATFDFDGELWTIERPGGHFLAFTEGHRWPWEVQYNQGRGISPANKLNKSHWLPLRGSRVRGEETVDSRLAAIIGWLYTDGYRRPGEAYICQSPKKHLDEIRLLVGNDYLRETTHPDTGVVSIYLSRNLRNKIDAVHARDKSYLPKFAASLGPKAAEEMWQAMFKAEGCTTNGQQQFVQKPGPVLEAFQILSYMTGRSTWITQTRDCATAYIHRQRKIGVREGFGRVQYTGKVWCPKTPTGTWYVRYKGMVMPTGNTFMRKNVPLMMESYFTNPGRMIMPTKAQNALSRFMGQDNRDEALPGMIGTTPQWMGVTPGVEMAPQAPGSEQVFMQPDMPYNQLEGLFGGFAQGNSPMESLKMGGQQFLKEILLEQSTPLVRTAAEYATQTDLGTGADQPQSLADAVINQIPVGRILQRPLSRALPGIFLESDRPGSPTYTVSIAGQKIEIGENVANYVTGMGFRKVTPERMKSELRRRQDILEALLKKIKENAIENEQEQWNEEYGEQYGTS